MPLLIKLIISWTLCRLTSLAVGCPSHLLGSVPHMHPPTQDWVTLTHQLTETAGQTKRSDGGDRVKTNKRPKEFQAGSNLLNWTRHWSIGWTCICEAAIEASQESRRSMVSLED
jgi:hypothetical protein